MKSGIIAIGAHPDDIELGCGASLAKLSNQGLDIFAIILSNGSEGNPSNQNRVQEASNALNLLGVNRTFFLNFADTKLSLNLYDIIVALEKILEEVSAHSNIERIYTMFKDDRHQDHRATYEASIVAFRHVKQILCYETPSSGAFFSPKVFENVDEMYLNKKIDSLQHHESQIHKHYMSPNIIKSIALLRGQQAGFPLGEGFEPYKVVF